MKSRCLICILALTTALLFLLTGCLPRSLFGPPKPSEAYTSPSEDTAGDASADAGASDTETSDESTSPDADEELDANWTLYVDQTIPKTNDGLKVNYTLLLIAQKTGGTDVYGSYKGVAYVGVNFDASQMSSSVMQMFGGFNVDAYSYDVSFDIIAYDSEAYSDYGLKDGDAPLAPLVTYESMALISPQMEGSGTLNPSVQGAQGESGGVNESSSGTTAIPMKITINSGIVSVSVPSFNLYDSFKGSLTGEPTGSSGEGDPIAQAAEKIEGILEDSAAEDAAASGSGSLGDILSQFKPN